ncbi:MAG: cytochrome c oxidase subunit VIa [Lasallia pustulata]|uniref:Cytochrome c oxidase subunit n=1 Tax=Lasallia pustulata TaxID=136370 RepID=A0A5M8PFX3_9LECA|nr:MAG: cytochrome c oxidase subunit VIa [Lasallia pustulata]
MLAQRSLLRASQRVSQQIQSPAIRSSFQRRLASSSGPPLTGPADNAFNRERQAVKAHAAATSDLWRKLSIYVTIPCLIIASVNAYNLWTEHWEHWEHLPPLDERPEYPYQNIRTKNFCWGDGDKTLFWNDKVNYHKKDA